MKAAHHLLLSAVMLMNAACAYDATPPAGAAPADPPQRAFFAYFVGNGETGMHLATSSDARTFTPMSAAAVLVSTLGDGLVRDPSIVRGPDGRWHGVWTVGWWESGFGVSHSDDLLHWSTPEAAPVMAHVKGTVNTWAPEIHWDPERSEYLVLWSSTVRGMFVETDETSEDGPDGRGLNHRIWAATTRDFTTWSEPRVFFDPGFSVIDAVIVRDEPRRRWVLVCKDERFRPEPRKELRVAVAERMQGPYTLSPTPITEAGTWVEGPTVLADDTGWTVFFDRYREGGFGAVRTSDWRTFSPVSGLSMPAGARHGCVFPATPGQ